MRWKKGIMFWSRLRSTSSPLECIVIYDVSDSSKGCVMEYICPSDYSTDAWSEKLSEFLIPCGHKSSLSEEYVLIFTDHEGMLDFVACLLLPMSGYLICVRSFNPSFEFFHGLLTIVNQEQLYSIHRRSQLEAYVHGLRVNDGIVTVGPVSYHFTLPDRKTHPFYHRYILEYYNTLSINNWIVILESLLLEKSIIFYSSRFQRVTSCILASLSLLYPLNWVHLIYPLLPTACIDYASCPSPFIAGIHSCLLEKVKRLINADVRLVDLDDDTVYVNGSFGSQLPNAIRQWLARGCNASHRAILKQRRSSQSRNSAAAALLVEPYLELMTILLGGYREAMQHTESSFFVGNGLSTREPNSPPFDQPRPGHWHFDRDVFIASRGRECQTYLRELLQSQMVIQFFESRVALLNSDLGIIPADDFEDAISRVSGPPRSNITELLNRGRVGFSRFARKLKKIRKIRMDQRGNRSKGAFMEISAPLPPHQLLNYSGLSNPVKTISSDSAQGDSSSSSSSEVVPYSALAELHLEDESFPIDALAVRLSRKPDTTHSTVRPSNPSPVDNVQLKLPDKSRCSLVTSIFNSVPDIPVDWLQSRQSSITIPSSASTPSSSSRVPPQSVFPPASNHIFASTTAANSNSLFGTQKGENTKRNCQKNDLLQAFDPYCPDIPAAEEKPTETKLAALLRELDPLRSNEATSWTNDPTSLLK